MRFTVKKTYFGAVLLLGLSIFTSGCEHEPIIPNEEELITTLTYTLTPSGGGTAITLTYKDLDGDGGNAPTTTLSGNLAANTTYIGKLVLLNESVTPAEDISAEIKAEKETHQFFFQPASALKATVSYTDTDANGKPVGLETSLVTTYASEGDLTIILRHEPNKSASGVATGDVTNAGGETDIEAVIKNVKIQ
ncbi:MAG: type 1 periplasmic binding fold superfamily protein [Bacteroidia bacterium]